MKNIIRGIIIFAILIVVILLVAKLVQDSKIGNNASEIALIKAAEKYYREKPYLLPSQNYAMDRVTSNVLVEREFLKQTKDQSGAPKNCSSYVTVTYVNGEYFYNPYVNCGITDDTLLLYDQLVSRAKVETKDGTNGIFSVGDKYIFRGDKPTNHVIFAGKKWRIMSISEDKSIKLFYNGEEAQSRVWDNRYNVNTNAIDGINDYSISRVKEYLSTFYNDATNFSNMSKAKMAYMDLCTGERDPLEIKIDGSIECLRKFEDQLIGLPSIYEYLSASNDPNCPTKLRTCSNYNFMARFNSFWSLTPVKGTTHKVYRIFPEEGLIEREATSKHYAYPVISLKADVAILGGNGSSENPYTLK